MAHCPVTIYEAAAKAGESARTTAQGGGWLRRFLTVRHCATDEAQIPADFLIRSQSAQTFA
jgi:hypothetical protein